MFTSEISDQLKYYVYRLIDPRNGQTFYVGKGKGNRVFAHAKGESDKQTDSISDKLQRIRDIRLTGFEVAHVIHRHGMDEKTAFEVEAALIDAYPEVTNIVSGHHADERGVMHSKQIIERYQAEEAEFSHKLMLVNIGKSALLHENIYEAARYAWPISLTKAKHTDYVLAHSNGIIVGVFIADEWLPATEEHFPDREPMPKRWGFIGRLAPEEIAHCYLRKKIPDSMRKRGAAFPVRYHL